MFAVNHLPDEIIESMVKSGVYKPEIAPVKLEQLKFLNLSYVDFSGEERYDGEMVCLDILSEKVINIFEDLLSMRFPIAKIKTIDKYQGSDYLSMTDNNTSCYNCRKIENSDKFSSHSYGAAIDINPVQNPYLVFNDPVLNNGTDLVNTGSKVKVFPPEGINYLNRAKNRPDKINHPAMVEEIVPIFHKYGFTIWGGNWDDPLDYHHFQHPY